MLYAVYNEIVIAFKRMFEREVLLECFKRNKDILYYAKYTCACIHEWTVHVIYLDNDHIAFKL